MSDTDTTGTASARQPEGENAAKLDHHGVVTRFSNARAGLSCYSAGRGWFIRDQHELWRPDDEHLGLRRWVGRELAEMKEQALLSNGVRTSSVVFDMQPNLRQDGAWDADPVLCGLPNNTVLNLRSGNIREGQETDAISRRLGYVPDRERKPERWLQFLEETVPIEDTDATLGFLKRWCGYTLTGFNREEKFILLLGAGGNGKSTFRDVLAACSGSYFKGLPKEAIFGRNPQHMQWLARLEGARCASVSEPDRGDKWRAGDLKDLTGGGMVTANFMRMNSFEFEPVCKLMVQANDAPRLSAVDEAIRRRLVLLPFNRTPNNPDEHLKQKLHDEGPQILAWMIEGSIEYLRDGLGPVPKTSKAAADEYLDGEDVFGQFLDDTCEVSPALRMSNARLKNTFSRWAEGQSMKAWSIRAIRKELLKRKFEPYRTGTERGFTGLNLLPGASSDTGASEATGYLP